MKKFISHWGFVIAALLFLVAVLAYNQYQITIEANRPIPVRETPPIRPQVSVIEVESGRYSAQLTTFGASQARFQLELSSQVAGRVEQIAEQFDSGYRVASGDWLIQLENSDYRAAVSRAEQALAAAQLTLLEEERLQIQAREEWLASGMSGEPDSPLVLREPQLAAARAMVSEATVTLESARKDLQQTRITAPFDALIVARHTGPGSFVQSGHEVATIYSTERVEIVLPLSAREWTLLPEPTLLVASQWSAQLSAVDGTGSWQAEVLRVEQHLDSETRQRAMVLSVSNPLDQQPALYPGTFLRVNLEGKALDGLWQLPNTALSQRGEVWYVSEDNTLQNFSAEPVFSRDSLIYVKPPADLAGQSQRVVKNPLNTYRIGMHINPLLTGLSYE
ncbi:efflux RND transporter periplasmic adaptor subunit [Methylophaga lonarensis]|uniref:efflux RND transporter periplasmic adaptor subunit n=1 Tax=Methylophaga lonarensis TaxID=999151 RepID=UPI003D2D78A8